MNLSEEAETQDGASVADSSKNTAPPSTVVSTGADTSIFRIPPLLKQLFDHFPLVVYPPNTLPLRSPKVRNQNVLYIFTGASLSPSDAPAPSFNPSNLKWQTLLQLAGIPFTTLSSNNHASPTGSLPFLIPENAPPDSVPLTGTSLESWIIKRAPKSSALTLYLSPLEKPYNNLLTYPIRLAYLYSLYLDPHTFITTTKNLYIDPASRSSFVRYCLTSPLRAAALAEITSTRASSAGKIDVDRLFRDAEEAFDALATLLESGGGSGIWFNDILVSGLNNAGRQSEPKKDTSPRNEAISRIQGESMSDPTRISSSAPPNSYIPPDEFESQGGAHRDSGFGLFDGDSAATSRAGSPPRPSPTPSQSTSPPGATAADPGYLDVAVFSYIHVILTLFASQQDKSVTLRTNTHEQYRGWHPASRLVRAISNAGGGQILIQHHERMIKRCYPSY